MTKLARVFARKTNLILSIFYFGYKADKYKQKAKQYRSWL